MNINCERVHLKRMVAVCIAFMVYMLAAVFKAVPALEHSLPIIVLFIGNYSFSYLPIFNRMVNIYRDDKYIVITDGGKQRKYEHHQQDKIQLLEASPLANYDELIISLSGKQLHFVLSVHEKDFYSKYKEWNSVNG